MRLSYILNDCSVSRTLNLNFVTLAGAFQFPWYLRASRPVVIDICICLRDMKTLPLSTGALTLKFHATGNHGLEFQLVVAGSNSDSCEKNVLTPQRG